MNIRKIGIVGGFAVGAALALSPLAAADTDTPADTTDFSSLVSSEVSFLNSVFEFQATLAGVDKTDIIAGDESNPFSTIAVDDVNKSFASLLYGFNPEDNAATDPGSYVIFNGAAVEFLNAMNVQLYSLANNGDLIAADDLFGSDTTITDALSDGTVSGATGAFLEAGMNDLGGYFDLSGLAG